MLAITNATIIDGTERDPYENGTIVIDGKHIQAIGKKDSELPPIMLHNCYTWTSCLAHLRQGNWPISFWSMGSHTRIYRH